MGEDERTIRAYHPSHAAECNDDKQHRFFYLLLFLFIPRQVDIRKRMEQRCAQHAAAATAAAGSSTQHDEKKSKVKRRKSNVAKKWKMAEKKKRKEEQKASAKRPTTTGLGLSRCVFLFFVF